MTPWPLFYDKVLELGPASYKFVGGFVLNEHGYWVS